MLPLIRLVAVLADYKIITEDIRPENYDDQYETICHGYNLLFSKNKDEFCENWSEEETDSSTVMVNVESFVSWAYDKQIPMPNEFLVRIGKNTPSENIKKADLDKHGCQVIAQTLWCLYPEMTNQDIREHETVRRYGHAKDYNEDSTVRKWISEVDPREKRRGPKKQNK